MVIYIIYCLLVVHLSLSLYIYIYIYICWLNNDDTKKHHAAELDWAVAGRTPNSVPAV